MFYRKLTLILFTLFIINLPFLKGKAEAPFSPGTNADGGLSYALGVYNAENTEMEKKWRALEGLEIQYAMLGVQWDSNQQEMIKNAIRLGNAVQLDILGAATSVTTTMAESMIDITDAYNLSVARANKAIEIEEQNVAVAAAVAEQGRAHAHYKVHYDAWTKKFSGSKKFIKRGATPSSVDIGDPYVTCKNPQCNTVYKASVYGLENIVTLAEGGESGAYSGYGAYIPFKGHLVTCSYNHAIWQGSEISGEIKPLSNVSDPFSYWSCPPKYKGCPYEDWHLLACPGKCGAYNVARTGLLSGHHYPHKKKCEEQVRINFTNFWKLGNCYANIAGSGWYWSCTQTSADCIYAHEHVDDDETVQMPDVDESEDSQQLCSWCSANGLTPGCQICDPQTLEPETTPAPDDDDDDDDDDGDNDDDDPPDTTTTCPCGVSYDPMVVSDHNTHRLRECRDCDNEWRKCISSTPPTCNTPWRNAENLPCRPLPEN